MDQWLEHALLLKKTGVQSPAPTSGDSQPPVSLTPDQSFIGIRTHLQTLSLKILKHKSSFKREMKTFPLIMHIIEPNIIAFYRYN